MNWSTKDVAEVYRRRGSTSPVAEACGGKPNKFNARRKSVDNITFDSTAEANAYQQLKTEEGVGAIKGLSLQPVFLLAEGFRDSGGKKHRAITYRADFEFFRLPRGDFGMRLPEEHVVVEVKGMETPVWLLKKKLFLAKYPHIKLEVWKRGKRP